MFKTVSLQEYSVTYSQAEAGRQLGYTRANIEAALKAGRDITLTVDKEGRIHGAYEVKSFGRLS